MPADATAIYVLAGAALLLAAVVPYLLARLPVSPAMVFVAAGWAGAQFPGAPQALPQQHPLVVEHAAELCVIVSLMGVGLALDRPFSLRGWAGVWRLLLVAMPVLIAVSAWGAAVGLGIGAATALLVGSVLAPTDPVLAGDVRVGEPTADPASEDDLRFHLTAEAGLNDALAFPFVHAALLWAALTSDWVSGWLWRDVVAKIGLGVAVGAGVGRGFAYLAFRSPPLSRTAQASEALVGLAAVLLTYGLAEWFGGYGFLAAFVAALALRSSERRHEYHRVMHRLVQDTERILTLGLLLGFGYALGCGLLAPLTPAGALLAAVLVLVLRPVVGWLSLAGRPLLRLDRAGIAGFGVKGIGSFYYVAYGLNRGAFEQEDLAWAVVGCTVLVSVVVHGVSATPVVRRLDRRLGRPTPAPM